MQGKRAAIYCRISETDDKVDKVEIQEKRCRAFCDKVGYDVVEVFADDGISAFTGKDRPQYQDMLRRLRRGEFDVIVATFQDRLSRQPVEILELLGACREVGAAWHTIHDGLVTADSDDDEMFAFLRGWIGRREITTRSKRQVQRFEEEIEAGRPLWGARPFGYEKDRITQVPGEVNEIRWAYEQVAGGATLRSIIRSWKDRGVQTVKGNDWSYATLRQLLLRPRNVGLMERHGEILESISVAWEPVIDRATWEVVRARLTDTSRAFSRKVEPRWLCAGLAKCGRCGSPMRSATGSDRKTSFPVYRCAGRLKASAVPDMDEDGKRLRHASAKCDELDDRVRGAVVAAFMFLPTSELPGDPTDAADVRRIQEQLIESRRQSEAVSESMGLPGFSAATLRRRAAALAKEQETLQAELDDVAVRSANSAMLVESRAVMFRQGRVNMDDAVALKRELTDRFDSLPLEHRRTLVRSLLDVTVQPGRGSKRFDIHHTVAKQLNESSEEQ